MIRERAIPNIVAEYERRTPGSKAALARSAAVIPGGLVQGSRFYPPYPLVIASGRGSKITDVDGNSYVDYFQAATAQFLGHSHPAIVEAVERQLPIGTNFGLHYEREERVAAKLTRIFPCAEMVKFTNTGMDACLLAVRVARVKTGRVKVATFRGHFHGWEDQLHAQYAHGIGIPPELQMHTIVLPYNDAGALEELMHREKLAAVILEPYSTNAGGIPPNPEFLLRLRSLASQHGTVLIFDECVSNFRLARGGAQEFFNVVPDLAVLGKCLSGGYSVAGALIGRGELLEVTDHSRGEYVYHGAWQSPVVMAAIEATLDLLDDGRLIAHASRLGQKLRDGLSRLFASRGVDAQVIGLSCVARVVFSKSRIVTADDIKKGDQTLLRAFHLGLINRGHFLLAGRHFYTCTVQSDAEIEDLLEAADDALIDATAERAAA
jgi:glutamate-1-semialdehyde 2,1-aminomutase